MQMNAMFVYAHNILIMHIIITEHIIKFHNNHCTNTHNHIISYKHIGVRFTYLMSLENTLMLAVKHKTST